MEMFAGELFWANGKEAAAVLANLLENGSRYDIVPTMPGKVAALLKSCFRREPEDRPSSMREIAETLLKALPTHDMRVESFRIVITKKQVAP